MRIYAVLAALAFLAAPLAVEAQGASPIEIDSRDDWLRLGVPGSGTPEDPFILSGLRFDLPERERRAAVTVKDVPDHAIVREILIVGGETGFVFEDAPNVVVENVTVRRSGTAFSVVNGTLRNVTLLENRVGVDGSWAVLVDSVVARNEIGIQGTNISVVNSRLSGNVIGYSSSSQPPIRATDPVPRIERSHIEGSRFGAQVGNALLVLNSSFDQNQVGIVARSPRPTIVVTNSNFGNHSDAALDIINTAPLACDATAKTGATTCPWRPWRMDARSNWWGENAGGNASAPSPFGFGAPVRYRDAGGENVSFIDHEPYLESRADAGPSGDIGARFRNVEAPRVVDDGSFLRTSDDGGKLLVFRARVNDSDGIAEWRFAAGDYALDARVEGETEIVVDRGVQLAPSTQTVTAVLVVRDLYGAEARFEQTYEEAVAEPDDLPPPAPADEERSPLGWLVAPAAAGAAAALRRRRG